MEIFLALSFFTDRLYMNSWAAVERSPDRCMTRNQYLYFWGSDFKRSDRASEAAPVGINNFLYRAIWSMTALATPEEQVPKTTSQLSSKTSFLKAITPFSGLYSVFPRNSSTFWPMIPPWALTSSTAILAAFNWSSPEGGLKGARTPILTVLAVARPDARKKKKSVKTTPIPIPHLFVFIWHLLFF